MKEIAPFRLDAQVLEQGINYKEDLVVEGYGVPVVITIRPLTQDEMEEVGKATTAPDTLNIIIKALGKTPEELAKLSPSQWSAMVNDGIASGKIPKEVANPKNKWVELCRRGIVDEAPRAHPENLLFGVQAQVGRRIEQISLQAPDEIVNFLKARKGKE